jgi:hypothetical protein
MNKGKVLKQLYSSEPLVAQLIEDAIQKWEFGYCEHTNIFQSVQPEQDDKMFIEISSQNDTASTETVIDAIMHLLCGFTHICLDYTDMEYWLSHGKLFRTLTIEGRHKELPYELWMSLADSVNSHEKNGINVKGILITVIGNIDAINPKEIELYGVIAKGFGFEVLINNCLFDYSIDTQLKVYLALQPQEKDVLISHDSELPDFLRR